MDNMEGDFSRQFKEDMRNNRHNDFERLVVWLNENKIPHIKEYSYIELTNEYLTIYDNMKVSFDGNKRYQYNLDGIKQRILNGNKTSNGTAFEQLINWLQENKIDFNKKSDDCIELANEKMIIYYDLQVKFDTSKPYQYNLSKLKNRIKR